MYVPRFEGAGWLDVFQLEVDVAAGDAGEGRGINERGGHPGFGRRRG